MPEALAQELPGHDIGVMLKGREDDPVARLEIGRPPAAGHEIEGRGGAGREDDLAGLARVEEALHPGAGALIALRRPLGQAMHPAVDIGVVLLDEAGYGIDDGAGLLGAGRRVEIDQGMAMDVGWRGSGNRSAPSPGRRPVGSILSRACLPSRGAVAFT